MRAEAHRRSDYRHFQEITTRWADNDAYGHVNNVVYYSWFDTVVNAFLINHGALDIEDSAAIGLVIETQCNYFSSIAFPDVISAGLRVTKIGHSSVRYEVGIFREGEDTTSAQGHFVHVYCDRLTREPAEIPEATRLVLNTIYVMTS